MTKTKRGFIALVSILALCITVSVLAQSAATILPKSATGAYMDDFCAEGNGRALTLNAIGDGQMQRGGGGYGEDEPPLPFLISGYVFYADGTACNGSRVNITDVNTGNNWTAKTAENTNYYQLVLNGTTEVRAGNTLQFDVKDETQTQTNTTERTVILDDIEMGGLYNFNITLESPKIHNINVTTDYCPPTGIRIKEVGGPDIPHGTNLTIGKEYWIMTSVANEGDFNDTVYETITVINETGVPVFGPVDTQEKLINVSDYKQFKKKWNTSGLTPGNYIIFVNASIVDYTDAHPENNNRTRVVGLETAATPELTSISVSPETVTLNVTETQLFTAIAYDQFGEEMPDIVFSWRSTNETVGTINEMTGLFTAITPGSTIVMAYNASVGQSVNGTAEVTVKKRARVPGDVNGDTEINIQDAVLLFNWVSFPSERGTTYILQ